MNDLRNLTQLKIIDLKQKLRSKFQFHFFSTSSVLNIMKPINKP